MESYGEDEVPKSKSLQKHQTSIDLNEDEEVDDNPIEETNESSGSHVASANYSADGVWLGWFIQKIPCRFPLYVVARKPGPSLFVQGIKRKRKERKGRTN
ncbi:hypothetical protein Q3G72_030910 [Acer saccharum]|nr:hypothetical protein Q3G72_030910 [Acer saccharum]